VGDGGDGRWPGDALSAPVRRYLDISASKHCGVSG
jgi:hypothetical protein